MSRTPPSSSQMPAEPWMFACGFRVVIGKLLNLTLPSGNHNDDPITPGICEILICEGVPVEFGVDFHTAIIGLQPSVTNGPGTTEGEADSTKMAAPRLHYHVGELVQVNLRARSKVALSVERYFSSVMHQSNALEG